MITRPCMLLTGIALAVSLPSCAEPGPPGTPIERTWESPAPPAAAAIPRAAAETGPASQPTTGEAPAPEDVLAVVNRVPILRSQMAAELLKSHGLSLLQQMVLLTAARQRAAEMGLTVAASDITAAHEDALRRLATPVVSPDEPPLDRAAAERLLDDFLRAKNISRTEWDRRMEQQAYLRAIAAAEVDKTTFTEAMLRQEYALAYDERVQVRHIQLSSLEAVGRARAQLAAGKDFELVARQMSENQVTAARGGLMAPFTRNDPAVAPLLREEAFNLQAGQVSAAVNEGNWYHLLRLERRFPASGVGFENADQQALRQRLRDRLITQRQQGLEAELFAAAGVEVRDPDLAREFRALHRRTGQ